MLEGLGFASIWRETLILAAITAVLIFLNIRNFKTRLA
jgi:ABC-2 type transport system permease protein